MSVYCPDCECDVEPGSACPQTHGCPLDQCRVDESGVCESTLCSDLCGRA